VSSLRADIAALLSTGHSQAAIARELSIAHATVGYHVRRLAEPVSTPPPAAPVPAGATRMHDTRHRVAALIDAGHTRREIARMLGLTKQTVSYHARRLGAGIDERFARRYDWELIQRYYDAGHTVRECCAAFGCSSASWHSAMRRGTLVTRPRAKSLDEILVEGRACNRGYLKQRLIQAGLKQDRCEDCGLVTWRDKPLSLSLHHVNGVRDDNRLENLRLLCPNCHSQTSNFAGRRRRAATAPALA
jgi:DNA-binding CsgD family transcriptional regulator